MRETLQIASGAWWRFSRYELEDGYLRPARAAKLEAYDPWAEYWRSSEERLAPPYESLLALLGTLKWTGSPGENSDLGGPAAPRLLSSEAITGLLTWCSTHGLLGVLPQRACLVTLAPRFRPLPRSMPRTSVHQLRLVQHEFVRGSTEWVVNERKSVPWSTKSRRDWEAMKGRLAPPDFAPDWNQPRAILQELWGKGLSEESLDKTWSRFFPTVSEAAGEYPWPVPLSVASWRLYAEPFEEFLWALISFKAMLLDLAGTGQASQGRDQMHALLASVSPVLDRGKQGGWKQQWASMSLLGSFAMMALLDLTEGWRVRECPVDRRTFVADAWQARYCSARCRRTAQKRAYRSKKKTAGEGQSSR